MADNTRYYTVDDDFGNPKMIKTGADGCEVLNYMQLNGQWRKGEYQNPYPVSSGEKLIECKKSDWDNILKKYNKQKVEL